MSTCVSFVKSRGVRERKEREHAQRYGYTVYSIEKKNRPRDWAKLRCLDLVHVRCKGDTVGPRHACHWMRVKEPSTDGSRTAQRVFGARILSMTRSKGGRPWNMRKNSSYNVYIYIKYIQSVVETRE